MISCDWRLRGTKDSLEKEIGNGFICKEGWQIDHRSNETILVEKDPDRPHMFVVTAYSGDARKELQNMLNLPIVLRIGW